MKSIYLQIGNISLGNKFLRNYSEENMDKLREYQLFYTYVIRIF